MNLLFFTAETWRVKGTRNRLQGLEWDKLSLETLFVDPPRSGLDEDTEKLMKVSAVQG